MTLQEIQYKAQAIMQEWRDEDSAPYVEFVEELALMYVPELPEGLEEAAEEYARLDDEGVWKDGGKYKGFIAGAEWMAEQGVTCDAVRGAFGIRFDGDVDKLLEGFEQGDKVIVQIRKK